MSLSTALRPKIALYSAAKQVTEVSVTNDWSWLLMRERESQTQAKGHLDKQRRRQWNRSFLLITLPIHSGYPEHHPHTWSHLKYIHLDFLTLHFVSCLDISWHVLAGFCKMFVSKNMCRWAKGNESQNT